jgi:predicted DNA-binding WGR domain protein
VSWRRFYFRSGRSDKFWCIRPVEEERSHEVWFGRSGTEGQHRLKLYASRPEMWAGIERIIDHKLNKGYIEVTTEMQRTEAITISQDSVARVVITQNTSVEAPRRMIVFD